MSESTPAAAGTPLQPYDTATASVPTRPVTNGFIAAYWFAQFATWLALLTPVVVTIAYRVAQIATPAEKAAQLGLVLGVGAFAAIIASPIWGMISDRTTWRMGRRKPYMIIGTIAGGVGLAFMAFAPNILVLGIGWFICQLAFNANQAVLNAVLPDVVPPQQRGRVSGLLGLSATVAILAGSFLTQYTSVNPVLMFLTPWVVCAIAIVIMLAVFRDRPAAPDRVKPFSLLDIAKSFWENPRKYPDFAWAWISRFFVFFGNAYLQTYQLYFLTDHLNVGASESTAFVFFSTFVTAVITVIISVLGGFLSDRFRRRKPFVLLGGMIAGAGLLVIGTSTTFTQFLIGVGIQALGQGLYYAVDLALVADVLPNPDNAAKDLGIFGISSSLPQSLAPTIAPIFLGIGAASVSNNYVAVFIAATTFAVLGALLILPIRGTK